MNYFFISPHLDDAIFSAGDLISKLSKTSPVTIITVFSEVIKGPSTLFAKLFIHKSGFSSSQKLFSARRHEDNNVCKSLGIQNIHLNYIDVAWRKKARGHTMEKFIPELAHLYPTRFHILSGCIHKEDNQMMQSIAHELKHLIPRSPDTVVFCPLGVGNQVDHIIVRDICKKNFIRVLYWQDYPYILKYAPNSSFMNRNKLKCRSFMDISIKSKFMLGYKSQIRAYFKKKIIQPSIEKYYSNKRSLLDLIGDNLQ